ncbi:hypothetical protein E2562_011448 [Oryza meyeriana var. granulata]|uniref:Uncharacterized protein n=1 Tax=Oryza meyeriana var. granulata TaxID=110450 RepID=A0A6G1D407_9ORYZ|nr:hypothetical protein E2562_011448 [Oryza meyeriana var. granulata]
MQVVALIGIWGNANLRLRGFRLAATAAMEQPATVHTEDIAAENQDGAEDPYGAENPDAIGAGNPDGAGFDGDFPASPALHFDADEVVPSSGCQRAIVARHVTRGSS